MKYISHIKDLVSGIIVNDLVTRDTEAYNALIALKNHLESLEEVYKYMPYKDPGPVIQMLEQGITQANTKIQAQKKVIEELNKENADCRYIIDQNHQAIENYQELKEELEQILDEMFTKADPDYASKPDIKWNFTKFLISKEGEVVSRFEPTTEPQDMEASIEQELAK